MSTAILELVPIDGLVKTTLAHLRIAKHLHNLIDDSVIWSIKEDYENNANMRFDNIVIVYSSRFGPFKAIEKFIKDNYQARLFWIVNEYQHYPNSLFTRLFNDRGVTVVANTESEGLKWQGFSDFQKINLNVTAFKKNAKVVATKDKKYDMMYYGTYRPDRIKYFEEYFQKGMIVSTSRKNAAKFRNIAPLARYIGKIDWHNGLSLLRQFKCSLYIEDQYTHTNFNHLADRFYEALSYDSLCLFDHNCLKNIELSGYDIHDECIVKSYNDCKKIYSDPNKYERLLDHQKGFKKVFERELKNVNLTLQETFDGKSI